MRDHSEHGRPIIGAPEGPVGQDRDHARRIKGSRRGNVGVEALSGKFARTHALAAAAWKQVTEHLVAQRRGREVWYADYQVRVATVTRSCGPDGPR